MPASPPLILASGSPYRRDLLARLGVAFETRSPDIDERRLAGESPESLVRRLAEQKARAVEVPGRALVIGSDQVAALGDEVLGKPGDAERAAAQLKRQSGRTVLFHTGVCVRDTADGSERLAVETVRVRFRELAAREIERYVRRERPYDCAGAFKSESLGVALCEEIESRDPTALVGLPLIAVCAMLRRAGLEVP